MTDTRPVIWWIRRDLRLRDNPALQAALAMGGPVIPLYIFDPQEEALGAAPKFRLSLGLKAFGQTLEGLGSRLILRRGKPQRSASTLENGEVLTRLMRDGRCCVHGTRHKEWVDQEVLERRGRQNNNKISVPRIKTLKSSALQNENQFGR